MQSIKLITWCLLNQPFVTGLWNPEDDYIYWSKNYGGCHFFPYGSHCQSFNRLPNVGYYKLYKKIYLKIEVKKYNYSAGYICRHTNLTFHCFFTQNQSNISTAHQQKCKKFRLSVALPMLMLPKNKCCVKLFPQIGLYSISGAFFVTFLGRQKSKEQN